MINWREYTIFLEQIFDVINVFYTRVNYMFLLSIFCFFWFKNSLASPIFTFNSESLQYFLPRLIMVNFFYLKTKYTSDLWYFFNQWDRKILWKSLSAVIIIFWLFNNLITLGITAFCLVKLLASLWLKICQYIGKTLLFQGTLIINILVFCHWVLSKINTNSEDKLNKFSLIFLTKGNQNKGRLNSFKVKNLCICCPLLYNFIGRGK